MNDSACSRPTIETISDVSTLSRTLLEALQIMRTMHLSLSSSLRWNAPLRLSLSRVELRLCFLVQHLCPSTLSTQEWQEISALSLHLKTRLAAHHHPES